MTRAPEFSSHFRGLCGPAPLPRNAAGPGLVPLAVYSSFAVAASFFGPADDNLLGVVLKTVTRARVLTGPCVLSRTAGRSSHA